MDLPADIVARAQSGQALAQAEVLRRAVGPARALIHRLGSPRDREDQLQEALAHLLRALPRFHPGGAASFSTWSFTVVSRWLLMQRRRRHLEVVPLEQAGAVADGSASAETQVQRRQVRRLLEDAVAALPEAQRRVFVLASLHELPLEAVAESEGVPVGTVKSRLHRARAELAHRLGAALDVDERGVSHGLGG